MNEEECLNLMEQLVNGTVSQDIELNYCEKDQGGIAEHSERQWKGFKIVGDNIDKKFSQIFPENRLSYSVNPLFPQLCCFRQSRSQQFVRLATNG